MRAPIRAAKGRTAEHGELVGCRVQALETWIGLTLRTAPSSVISLEKSAQCCQQHCPKTLGHTCANGTAITTSPRRIYAPSDSRRCATLRPSLSPYRSTTYPAGMPRRGVLIFASRGSTAISLTGASTVAVEIAANSGKRNSGKFSGQALEEFAGSTAFPTGNVAGGCL